MFFQFFHKGGEEKGGRGRKRSIRRRSKRTQITYDFKELGTKKKGQHKHIEKS